MLLPPTRLSVPAPWDGGVSCRRIARLSRLPSRPFQPLPVVVSLPCCSRLVPVGELLSARPPAATTVRLHLLLAECRSARARCTCRPGDCRTHLTPGLTNSPGYMQVMCPWTPAPLLRLVAAPSCALASLTRLVAMVRSSAGCGASRPPPEAAAPCPATQIRLMVRPSLLPSAAVWAPPWTAPKWRLRRWHGPCCCWRWPPRGRLHSRQAPVLLCLGPCSGPKWHPHPRLVALGSLRLF